LGLSASLLTGVRNNANIVSRGYAKDNRCLYQDDPDTVPVLDWLDSLPTKALDNVGFESNGCVIWGMNFDAQRPTFYEMGFRNYGFDSEPRIIECYISSMVGLQQYWRTVW
jgi:hypothetical protein